MNKKTLGQIEIMFSNRQVRTGQIVYDDIMHSKGHNSRKFSIGSPRLLISIRAAQVIRTKSFVNHQHALMSLQATGPEIVRCSRKDSLTIFTGFAMCLRYARTVRTLSMATKATTAVFTYSSMVVVKFLPADRGNFNSNL